jgi:hypothetical protein
VKRWLIPVGLAVLIILAVFYALAGRDDAKKVASSPHEMPPACLTLALSHNQTLVTLNQHQQTPLPTVEEVMRTRRLNEQFCIMMANCVANQTRLSNGIEMTPALRGSIVSAEFSSCLDDEEHSDAGESRK